MILVDAHVHIYDCFDLRIFLDSALANFRAGVARGGYYKFTAFLLLTEASGENWFQRLKTYACNGHEIAGEGSEKWTFHPTDENCSLRIQRNGDQSLYIVAGRQIQTAENLEILALVTDSEFADGLPLHQTIQIIRKDDAIPVLPWGFGKWMGRRGRILKFAMEKADDSDIFLGDNGGRPSFWPKPSHFDLAASKGIRILPGSDPLPFSSESRRPGSVGFVVQGTIHPEQPAEALKFILLDPSTRIMAYGKSEKLHRFVGNQLRMQIKNLYEQKGMWS